MLLSRTGVTMIESQVAWVTTGIFLAGLILLRRFQKVLTNESPEGFRRVSSGLSLLSLAVLARLFHVEGMFARTPFLSEPIFFDLAYWIAVIGGGSMLVHGASDWLPLAKRSLQGKVDQVQGAELVRRVQQLVGVESRIDTVLANTLQYMKEQVGLSYGAVFKCSLSRTRIELTATTSEFPMPRNLMDESVALCFAGRRREEQMIDFEKCLSLSLPPVLGRPSAMIPVEVGSRKVSCFVLWKLEGSISSDDRLTLQLAADIIAHKIDRDHLVLARHSDRERSEWFTTIIESVIEAKGSSRRVAALAKSLADIVPYDLMAVTVVPGEGRRTTRYSMAEGGNILVEKAVEAPLSDALTAPAFYGDGTVVFGDLSTDRQPDRREVLTIGLVRSLISVPVHLRGELAIVMTLTSGQKDAFSDRRRETLELLRPLVVMAVQEDILELVSRRELSRFERIEKLVKAAVGEESTQLLLNGIAGLAAEETGAEVVRVATLDKSGVFIGSRVLIAPQGRNSSVPPDGQLILPLMPLHDRAVRSGQIVASQNQTVDELSAMEAHQIFNADLKQTSVVPMTHAGRTVGVITLGWLDNRAEVGLDTSQRIFLETLAQMSAPLLSQGQEPAREEPTNRMLRRVQALTSSLGKRRFAVPGESRSEVETDAEVHEIIR